MRRNVGRRAIALGILLTGLVGVRVPETRADDNKPPDKAVVDEILNVLHQRGDISDDDYQRLLSKNATAAAKQQGLFPSIQIFGDVRQRFESYVYQNDQITSRPNIFQGRYRARLGVQADVNDYVTGVIRLGTSQTTNGNADNRSENISYGNTTDWAYGPVFIDLAYIDVHPLKGYQLPIEGAKLDLLAGKMLNPLVWTNTPDRMLFDNDITPEGGAAVFAADPLEHVHMFVDGGYFVVQNNTGFKQATPPAVGGTNQFAEDPAMIAAQVGSVVTPVESLDVGWRAAWYGFRNLNAAFFTRGIVSNNTTNPSVTNSGGNVLLSTDSEINVAEGTLYLTWRATEDWPVTLWGKFAENFSAGHIPNVSSVENISWSAGSAIGDKTKWVRFDVDYYYIEADAFPSQFIDSDILDGQTNRKAWVFELTRQLWPHTEARLWFDYMDPINTGKVFSESVSGSRRLRSQVDLLVTF